MFTVQIQRQGQEDLAAALPVTAVACPHPCAHPGAHADPWHILPPSPQRFVEDLVAVGKVDGAINFKTSTFSCTMAPNK